jgi:hypothetical protein
MWYFSENGILQNSEIRNILIFSENGILQNSEIRNILIFSENGILQKSVIRKKIDINTYSQIITIY